MLNLIFTSPLFEQWDTPVVWKEYHSGTLLSAWL